MKTLTQWLAEKHRPVALRAPGDAVFPTHAGRAGGAVSAPVEQRRIAS
ncbi:MAG: hypothetical protein FWF20_04235 [Betaproteobacteria bacterium]|nr:hypothetical protein [Betaproteobacteria bacterium]MCL2885987.1 hypothetical protein [Betaproteobacteria bacterium]